MYLKNIKTISVFSACFFASGLILGRLSIQSHQKDIKSLKTEINTKSEQIDKSAQKTITKVVYKTYYKTGEVKSESIKTNELVKVNDISKNYQTISKYENYKNWQIGILYQPTDLNFDVKKITPQISYRVTGDLWITAQSDLEITKPMLGLQYQF